MEDPPKLSSSVAGLYTENCLAKLWSVASRYSVVRLTLLFLPGDTQRLIDL